MESYFLHICIYYNHSITYNYKVYNNHFKYPVYESTVVSFIHSAICRNLKQIIYFELLYQSVIKLTFPLYLFFLQKALV